MRTLIDKINHFENTNETVESFNKIFVQSQLFGFSANEIVTIGEISGPDTARYVTVLNETFRHNFKPVEADKFVEVV